MCVPSKSAAQAQYFPGPVGIGPFSGKTAEAPLHIYTTNSGTHRLLTIHETQPAANTPGFLQRHLLYFDRSSSGYPTDIKFMDATGSFSGSTCAPDLWWERSKAHKWGFQNTTCMTLTGDGTLGIGTSDPVAPLHVYNGTTFSTSSTSRLFTVEKAAGSSVNSEMFGRTLYLRRNTAAYGWAHIRLHDGIHPQNGNSTPGSTTRTWWERFPAENTQSWGDQATTYMTLKNGNLGIGMVPDSSLHEKLTIDGGAYNAQTRYQNQYTPSGGLLVGVEGSSNGSGFIILLDNKDLRFCTGGTTDRMRILANGNVVIGDVSNPSEKLEVKGRIKAYEIISTVTLAPDFVFAPDYNLPTLQQVEEHIQEHGHLPDIPPAAEMEENGIGLSEMNMKLLQKVEELMLYTIEQNKQLLEQNKEIQQLKEEVKSLHEEKKNK